jgi:hypothetical protein
MEQSVQVFMDYAAAFEETYVDDDWSRLTTFFHEDARYEVCGGPMALTFDHAPADYGAAKPGKNRP